MNATAQSIDPEAVLSGVLDQATGLVMTIKDALARLRNVDFRVPDETDDHLEYRMRRESTGPLSPLGEQVMLDLLKLGLTDEQVGARMSVSPNGVGHRRRRWGRRYAQKG